MSPADWIEKNVRMSWQHEGRNDRVDYSTRPWLREIVNATADPLVRFIRIKAGTQIGKTLLLCSVLLYLAETAPATAMVVCPNSSEAKDFRERLYSLAEESGLKIPPVHKWNMNCLIVGDMKIFLAWPTSKARVRSRRCKYVFRTEVDVFDTRGSKDDPIEATNQRTKSFSRFLILDESTPYPHTSRIDKLEADSTQYRWRARCPHCGCEQEVRFFTYKDGELAGRCGVAGFTDRDGNLVSKEDARRDAHYICRNGCEISQAEQSLFMRAGRWKIKGKRRGRHEVGYHLWRAMSHSWGEIAAEYIQAVQDGKLPDFFQNCLGLSYQVRGKTPTWNELGKRMAGPNVRGNVPHEAWFLTAGGDVQDDGVYCSVRGWGDAKTSWGVDWYYFERQPGDENDLVKSDLAQIESTILDRMFSVSGGEGRNPRGRNVLGVAMLCIDANHRTEDLHNWWLSLPEIKRKRVRLIKGESTVKPEQMYRLSIVQHPDRDKTRTYKGGLNLWLLNHDVFGIDLVSRFRSDPQKPGAWFVTSDCLDCGQFYLKQVVNEELIPIRQPDGRYKYGWAQRSAITGHDYKDTEVYSMAAAQMVVDAMPGRPGWDARDWPRPVATKQEAEAAPAVSRDFS